MKSILRESGTVTEKQIDVRQVKGSFYSFVFQVFRSMLDDCK